MLPDPARPPAGPIYALAAPGLAELAGGRSDDAAAVSAADGVVLHTDWPVLVDAEEALAALGQPAADDLRERAADYADLVSSLFDGPALLVGQLPRLIPGKDQVTVLAESWHGFPAGSLAFAATTDAGEAWCFVRRDVVIDPATGEVRHLSVWPKVQPITGFRALSGGPMDAVFTLGEYASFLIPGWGPLVAGVVHVIRDNIHGGGEGKKPPPPPLPAADAILIAARAYISERVEEYETMIRELYAEYLIKSAQAKDDGDIARMSQFRGTVNAILTSSSFTKLAVLGDSTFRRRGAFAWAFANQFQLLLFRQGIVLDGWAYQHLPADNSGVVLKNLSDSPSWPELPNRLLGFLSSLRDLADTLRADAEELASHVISKIQEHGYWGQSYSRDGFQSPPEWHVEYYYYTDSARPGEELGKEIPSKKNSNAKGNAEAACARYAAELPGKLYGDKYGVGLDQVAQLASTVAKTAWSALENLELFIVPCAKDWDSGDVLRALGVWPGEDLKPTLYGGAQVRRWGDFQPLDAAEITPGFLNADSSAVCNVRRGQGLELRLPEDVIPVGEPAGTAPKPAFAVQVRCLVPEEASGPRDVRGRELAVGWADLMASSDEGTRRSGSRVVWLPPTKHTASGKVWLSRTVTIPLPAYGGSPVIRIEGHGDHWAPDIVSVRVAILDPTFPAIVV
ncbi:MULTISPECIES: hypothetical protein [Arthrobacter]|uniref:Uncharacterized protein n=1 Tax=Arthrobacter terricola TaxID=2547396 RepID=A0A4R5KJM3_9MICC|nr:MULTISPECIES: hypothetical protein [Arthrobacter]MBT8161539.1 hypothetical protein [Arthrobacter sp. GN70]TDF95703.1 hypothetical protein E1809_11855 [Arthrobacter terricola]